MNDNNPRENSPITITITREDLYERVWSVPIVKLSKSLGLSDRGLSKLCKRHSIPTPGLGYWRKLEMGSAPERPGLPSVDYNQPLTFVVFPEENKPTVEYPKIEVPGSLRSPHPILEKTINERKLRGGKSFFSEDETILHVRVTKDHLQRAFRIIDTVIKELEHRGATISVRKRHEIVARIGAEEVPFHIEEKTKLVLIEGSEEEKKKSWYRPQRDFEPTGRLSLVIDTYADFMRRNFQDGAKQRVEDTVGEFVITIIRIAELHRRRTEEQRLEEIESQKRREKIRQENAKVEFLQGRLKLVERAMRIERYLELIKSSSEPDSNNTWTVWVMNYLERVKQAVGRVPSDEDLRRLGWRNPSWD